VAQSTNRCLAAAGRSGLSHRILATGQHEAQFDDALAAFGLMADLRAAPFLPDPSPDVMAGRLTAALAPILAATRPDMVLVQGDTTSAYATTIAAHRAGIPIAHVEAGLRSYDFDHPWPEERNRVAIDRMATLLFTPTPEAAANLGHDGDVHGHIFITGNTGIDALLAMRAHLPKGVPPQTGDPALILLTCHRRESIGAGIANICAAALRLTAREDVRILCPVHPNPAVGDLVRTMLGRHPRISLTGALPYRDMVAAIAASRLILSDSGGVQEEAPALGIPVLVLRDVTERPEGLASGNLALVGTDPDRIVAAATRLLDDPAAHAAMARPAFPFGDGRASEKILDHIERYFLRAPRGEHPLPFAPVWIKERALKGA
jgi:UDP-N-acetylglucosamine 2-epimerase (non-hydrolysing)